MASTSTLIVSGKQQMRKDAVRNREQLIKAASAVMRAEGSDVPMEAIAQRAGLTRGTLYRNFPHRQAIYEAVLEHDLADLTAKLAAEQPNNPFAFVRRMAELMMVYDKFLVQLAGMADYDAAISETRMGDVLAPYLASAQQRGMLRDDLTGSDILVACRMLASHWKLDGLADFPTVFEQRLTLLLRGMSAPDSTSGEEKT